MKPTTLTHHLVKTLTGGAIGILVIASLIFPGPTQAEDHYTVGDLITVPITYSSSLPVIAADFTVTITNGTIQNLQCGGSGFITSQSTSTRCTLVHTLPSSSTGTVAIATVKATAIGTLTVSATGTLDAALGILATGSYTGGSYQIVASSTTPTPTPTPTPSTSTPTTNSTSLPTPTAALQTLASSLPTAQGTSNNSQTTSQSTNQTTKTSTSTTTTKTTSSSSSPNSSTSTEGDTTSRLVITAKDTRVNQPIPVGGYKEIFFTPDALPAATDTVVLDLPENGGETWLNLSSYMEAGQSTAMAVLPKNLMLRNIIDGKYVTITLPKGVGITIPDTSLASGEWNGLMLASSIAKSRSGNQDLITLSVGQVSRSTKLSMPVEIVFPNYGKWKAAMREGEQSTFQDLATCDSSTNPLAVAAAGSCQKTQGDDLHIWTNHFSQFQLSHAAITWETVLLILTEVALLIFIIITLRPGLTRMLQKKNVSKAHASRALKKATSHQSDSDDADISDEVDTAPNHRHSS